MSLSFLAKKTWHTQRTDNVEQVWLAEQKKEKEEKTELINKRINRLSETDADNAATLMVFRAG